MAHPSVAQAAHETMNPSGPVSRDGRQALRLEWQIARVRAADAQLRRERARLRQLLALLQDELHCPPSA